MAVRIKCLHPHALIIREWGPRIRARTAAQRHCDLTGGFGGDAGPANRGDEGAIADIAGEEDLVYAGTQLRGAQNITATDETGIALDDRPKLPDATALYPPPRVWCRWYSRMGRACCHWFERIRVGRRAWGIQGVMSYWATLGNGVYPSLLIR